MSDSQDYYKVSTEKALIFASTFLLVQLERKELSLKEEYKGAEFQLREIIDFLSIQGYLSFSNEGAYALTEKGVVTVAAFENRYSNILTYIDIFSAIDLERGIFAFEKFGTFGSEKEWQDYLNAENWADLRVAMIDYLDGDAVEFVFSQMLLDKGLTVEEYSWKSDLTNGAWWREIQDICDNAIQEEDLSCVIEGRSVSGEQVLEDIFDQGIDLLAKLIPEDTGLKERVNSWYSDEVKVQGYGASITVDSTSLPPWETAWSL